MASTAKRALVLVTALVTGCAGAAIAPPPTGPSTTSTPAVLSPTPNTTTGPGPEVTRTPTPGQPSPTPAEPTPLPPCQGEATAATFEPDSIACVVQDQLRRRSMPSTADGSLKFEPLLETGERLFIMDGPTSGSGYTWYLVKTFHRAWGSEADGWVAAGAKDGTPWLATTTVPCPADPTLETLAWMEPLQRLHCYHAREFTFTATVEAGPMCGDGTGLTSPAWMATCRSVFSWGEPKSLILALPPDIIDAAGNVEPDEPFQATFTAHMDDPAAQTCVFEGFEDTDFELLNPGVILKCRWMFVATSFERIAP